MVLNVLIKIKTRIYAEPVVKGLSIKAIYHVYPAMKRCKIVFKLMIFTSSLHIVAISQQKEARSPDDVLLSSNS